MKKFRIVTRSLPKYCEICHKVDCFDAKNNYCSRCRTINLREMVSMTEGEKLFKDKKLENNSKILKRAIKGLMWGTLFGALYTMVFDEIVCGIYWSKVNPIISILEGSVFGALIGMIFSVKVLFKNTQKHNS